MMASLKYGILGRLLHQYIPALTIPTGNSISFFYKQILQMYFRVWCVRFNPFHDQLLLTASSDARVLLSSAASVSSENSQDVNIHDDSLESSENKQM